MNENGSVNCLKKLRDAISCYRANKTIWKLVVYATMR
jgi:hypothetical protein